MMTRMLSLYTRKCKDGDKASYSEVTAMMGMLSVYTRNHGEETVELFFWKRAGL